MLYACPICKGELKEVNSKGTVLKGLVPTNRSFFCNNCGLEFKIYMKAGFKTIPDFRPPDTDREVLDHESLADKYAPDYDTEEFFRNEIIHFFDEFEKGIILPDIYNFYKEQGTKIFVLDVGCGTGRMLLPLSNYANIEAYGMDLSANMISKAADKLYEKWKDNKVNLSIGDSQYIPFKEGVFDICLLNFGVLSFAPNYKKTLNDLNFVLKEGGVVWLSTYNKEGLNFYVSKYYKPSTVIEFDDENHIKVKDKRIYCKPFEIDELSKLLEKAGFEVEFQTTILSILPLIPKEVMTKNRNLLLEWVSRARELERIAQEMDGLRKLGAYIIIKAKKC